MTAKTKAKPKPAPTHPLGVAPQGSTQAPAPPVKPQRSVELVFAPFLGNPGVVQIEVQGVGASYMVWPVPGSSGGREFTLLKQGEEQPYHVRINGDSSVCDCPDHQYRHRECKHLEALRALVTAKRL